MNIMHDELLVGEINKSGKKMLQGVEDNFSGFPQRFTAIDPMVRHCVHSQRTCYGIKAGYLRLKKCPYVTVCMYVCMYVCKIGRAHV